MKTRLAFLPTVKNDTRCCEIYLKRSRDSGFPSCFDPHYESEAEGPFTDRQKNGTDPLTYAINNKRCDVKLNHHIHNAILSNTSILATNRNFYQLCFLESLNIKTIKPCINTGIKATKELALFA